MPDRRDFPVEVQLPLKLRISGPRRVCCRTRRHGWTVSVASRCKLIAALISRSWVTPQDGQANRATANTGDLEQAIMNPLLDVTLRVQLEATLRKMKARERDELEYE